MALAFVSGLPEDGFDLDGEWYCDLGYGDWSGFYDWLRSSEGSVLGVRYWPDIWNLVNTLSRFQYVERSRTGSYCEIFFSSRRDFDRKRSADQAFIYDKLFRSDSGVYAIAFELSELADSQVARLREEALIVLS